MVFEVFSVAIRNVTKSSASRVGHSIIASIVLALAVSLVQIAYAEAQTPLPPSWHKSQLAKTAHNDLAFSSPVRAATKEPRMSQKSGSLGGVLTFLRGRPVRDGVAFLPFGHYYTEPSSLTKNYLTVIIYRSMALGTFVNSFGDQTTFLAFNRKIFSHRRFGMEYLAGLMVGYQGNLAKSSFPLSKTFLFTGNVNPVFGLSPYYRISERFELRAVMTPLVILLGVKYNF